MRKLILLLLAMTAGSYLIGLPNLWNYIRYPKPVVVACDQPLGDDLPTYVRLQKINLRGTEALWSNSREGTKIYIPVHFTGKQPTDQVSVILESDDPDLLTAAARVGGKHRAEQEIKLLQAFAQKTEATGMLHGSPADMKLKADLGKLSPLLAKDYVVLQEGDSPSLGLGLLGLIVGTASLAALNWIRTRPSRQPSPVEPPPLPPKL